MDKQQEKSHGTFLLCMTTAVRHILKNGKILGMAGEDDGMSGDG